MRHPGHALPLPPSVGRILNLTATTSGSARERKASDFSDQARCLPCPSFQWLKEDLRQWVTDEPGALRTMCVG